MGNIAYTTYKMILKSTTVKMKTQVIDTEIKAFFFQRNKII